MRFMRWLLWLFGGLSALLALAIMLLFLAANTHYGRTAIEKSIVVFSDGLVQVSGLDGHFPGQLAMASMVLQDVDGTWLTVDDLMLDWQFSKLLSGELVINRLQVGNIKLEHLPASKKVAKSNWSLPAMTIDLSSLIVERLELAASVYGQAANFAINGRLKLSKINQADIDLHINRLDQQGAYRLQANLTDGVLDAHLSVQEAATGTLARLAGLTNQGDLNLNASLSGQLAAIHSHLALTLDDLQMQLGGYINWPQTSVDLLLTAKSTALQLRSDLAWQALVLNLRLTGLLTELNVNGGLQLDKLDVGSTDINKLAINVQGTNGQLKLEGELAGIDLLPAEPLMFQATVDLAKPDFPATLTLHHGLISAKGQATMQGGQANATMDVTLPNLQPVAALAGINIAGSANLNLKYANKQLAMAGQLNFGSADQLWAKVLGEAAKFDLDMTIQGDDLKLTGLHLNGKALSLTVIGGLIAGDADFNWQAQLEKFAGNAERFTSQGRLYGRLDDLSLSSALKGELSSPVASLAANLQLQHLPYRPEGGMTLGGMLLREPVDLKLTINSPELNFLNIAIDKAHWQSANAIGSLAFSHGSSLPMGNIDIKIERLADLQALLKQPITGSAHASLETVRQNKQVQTKLTLVAINAGLKGRGVIEQTRLTLNINDLVGKHQLDGLLDLKGFTIGTQIGSGQIKFKGALDALSVQMTAATQAADAVQLTAAALLNTDNSRLLFNALTVNWHQQSMRLLTPANISYRDGLSVDRLRLGVQHAELALAGRITPDLALTAELHQASAELLSLFMPIPEISGTINANANVHGSLTQPIGQLHIAAEQLQFKDNQGLPPAQFTASAQLRGETVDLDATLKAGSNIDIRLTGQAPMKHTGLLALHSEGALDLKLFNPVLNVSGRRISGQLTANVQLAGKWSSPVISGSAQINHGEWQDFTNGIGINAINAALLIEDGALRIVKMEAHAGQGIISVTGSIGLLTAGMPVNLTIKANNARPLAGDNLTVNLDADLLLEGMALEQMTASGRIHLNRVDIQIPERLPTGIAILKLSTDPPTIVTASSKENSQLLLNLTIEAPREIFIRGRGVNAELGGTVLVTGDLNHPHPDGDFKLRNGQYTLAGQVLVFNQGSVGFDNNSLTNPTLNFVALSTRNNITATVTVSGSVQQLNIALSSLPVLPQDEVLANLLFGKGAASLSPLEMVQITAALASLTGVTTGIGDPLESARKLLGLDRLSVGGVNPTLEAGRYIAPGVYLGAKQGIIGGTPQPIIQIDVTKNLKFEAGVGSGAAASSSEGSTSTNSVGVIYQIDY